MCPESLTTVVRLRMTPLKQTSSILRVERYTITRPYQRSHAANWPDETVLSV